MTDSTFDDLKLQATRSIYAGVGAADRAVRVARGYVADLSTKAGQAGQRAQQTVAGIDYSPAGLRDRAAGAVGAVTAGVEAAATDARTRVVDLQAQATKQALDGYTALTKQGQTLVGRIRRQQSTQDTAATARTTVAKAKTTRTQAAKAASATQTAAKPAGSTTRKRTTTASKSPARSTASSTARSTAKSTAKTAASSAKATGTSARKTAANTAKAAGEAAGKVGD